MWSDYDPSYLPSPLSLIKHSPRETFILLGLSVCNRILSQTSPYRCKKQKERRCQLLYGHSSSFLLRKTTYEVHKYIYPPFRERRRQLEIWSLVIKPHFTKSKETSQLSLMDEVEEIK